MPAVFYRSLPLRTLTLPPASHTNCYVLGHRDALVVDPGTPFRGELQRLRSKLWRIRGSGGTFQAVFLTHHHSDHVASAQQLADELTVPIAAHPGTLARLPLAGPTVEIDDQHRFVIDQTVEVVSLHTPGHAPGHLCLFEPRRRYLLSGDMIPGGGTTLIRPSDGDMAIYLASLRRLAALEPSCILPAHGPVVRDGTAAVNRLIDHRLWREQRVLRALSSHPQDLPAVTARAYAEVSPLLWPLTRLSTLSHLHKLQRDGRATSCDGDRWVRNTDPA